MEDYGSLVDGLRLESKFFDQMVSPNETSILFENSILAIETLVAENEQLRDYLEGYGTHGAIAYAQTELRRQSAGRIEALKERNKALEALAESRARFGDSEARRAELEAVIEKVRDVLYVRPGFVNYDSVGEGMIRRALDIAPFVVLAARDREVAARALEDTADYFQPYFTVYADKLRIRAAAIRKGDNA